MINGTNKCTKKSIKSLKRSLKKVCVYFSRVELNINQRSIISMYTCKRGIFILTIWQKRDYEGCSYFADDNVKNNNL